MSINCPLRSLRLLRICWRLFLNSISAHNQLDKTTALIPLNIAEGNGEFTSSARCKKFDNARGSALESAVALDVLVATGLVGSGGVVAIKEMLVEIVSMLVGLIKANSEDRKF